MLLEVVSELCARARWCALPVVPPPGMVVGDVPEQAAGLWLEGQSCELIYGGNHHGGAAVIHLIVYRVGRDRNPLGELGLSPAHERGNILPGRSRHCWQDA